VAIPSNSPADSAQTIGSVRSQEHSQRGLEQLTNLVTPFAIRVAATLRLADLVTEGVTDPDALAERAGAHPDALRRLLQHLSCHDLFTELEDGTFAVGPMGQQLRSDHPLSMRSLFDLDSFSGRSDLASAYLLHSIRTGQAAYELAFGRPFWDDFLATPSMMDSFDPALDRIIDFTVRSLLRGYDWNSVEHVVDVGGGSGAPLMRLLRKYEHLRATLVDFPAVVERTERTFAAEGLAERVTFVGGSYFDPLPAGGDVYLLSEVVDQEPEDRAVRILRGCADAAGEGGTVVLLQTPITKSNKATMTALDLRMLATVGGQELTIEAYTDLVAKAGLELTDVYPRSGNTTFSVALLVCTVR
jgi:hypothetical protein